MNHILIYFQKYKKHFNEKPNDGCYVCLCKKGYYHCVPSGFPGLQERNMHCPNCDKEIGDNYFRIFKDEKEIELVKKDKNKRDNIYKINYITIKEFEEKYMNKLYEKEKGLPTDIDKNYYLKDNKIIRNLSQISYRKFNYILYSNLFFARIFTKQEIFDKYKPKEMKWGEIINESYILLKKELEKKGINSIERFI